MLTLISYVLNSFRLYNTFLSVFYRAFVVSLRNMGDVSAAPWISWCDNDDD